MGTGTTTYQYQAYATSSFDAHSLLGAIVTAQAIVLAVIKPVAAKLSDSMGRAETYALACLFYVCFLSLDSGWVDRATDLTLSLSLAPSSAPVALLAPLPATALGVHASGRQVLGYISTCCNLFSDKSISQLPPKSKITLDRKSVV